MSNRVYGDRITLPTFKIVSSPTISIAEVKQRRFNIIDRHQSMDSGISAQISNIIEGII